MAKNTANSEPMSSLFTLNLGISGSDVSVDYDSLDDCLTDPVLKNLFDEWLIEKCSVYIGTKRITALPATDTTWGRLREQIISNATTILRNQAL